MRAFFVLFLFLASFFTRAQTVVIIPYFYIDPDAMNFINSAGITSNVQRNAIDKLVRNAKASGWWSKCIAIYPIVGGTASSHAYNLKNPSLYTITWSGSITHNSNGATSNGGIGNTNLIPSSKGLVFNNVHISASTTKTGTKPTFDYAMGGKGSTAATTFSLLVSETAGNSGAYMNANAQLTMSTGYTGSGIHISSRNGTNMELYVNTTLSRSSTTYSGGSICPVSLYVLGYNNNGTSVAYSSGSICNFFTIGTSLTSTEANDMATDISQFNALIGR